MPKNATAIVIGVGAERGLGAALARRFAHDCHVFVVGRTQARIDQTTDAIRRGGGSAESFRADATSENDIAALFDRAMSGGAAPPAEVVLFNAGNSQPNELKTSTV